MNTLPGSPPRQSGFSMVELMIALVLGLILTAGVISVYVTSKKTYSLNIGVGQVQESGRFALSFMEKPIRMAGYTGCNHSTGNNFYNHLNGGTNASFNLADGIQGYEANGTGVGSSYTITAANLVAANDATKWTPNLPADIFNAIQANAIAGSDIVVLHEGSTNGFALVPDGSGKYQDSAGVFVSTASAAQLADGEIAVMTDCSKASLFQISNIGTNGSGSSRLDHSAAAGSPGNCNNGVGGCTPPAWPETYGAGSQLLFFDTFVFYIGVGADGGPSLYEVSIGSGTTNGTLGTPVELVPGVENMQILYGVDTDGTDKIPNNFQTASAIAAASWPNVVSIRVGLLTRSDDNSVDTAPTTAPVFTLLGISSADTTNGVTLTTIKDRRLRRTFTETISIRNSLP